MVKHSKQRSGQGTKNARLEAEHKETNWVVHKITNTRKNARKLLTRAQII